jgi:hypothetical protein
MPPSAAVDTLNKHRLRAQWNTLCERDPMLFPVPFRLLRYSSPDFSSLMATEQNMDFREAGPLIVKPDALDASIAIKAISNWQQLDLAVKHIRAEVEPIAREVTDIRINVSPAVIIEHQIPRSKQLHAGAEFSAEFISFKAPSGGNVHHMLIGITQKYINQYTFVEVCHCFPGTTFPNTLHKPLEQATISLLDYLGVQFSISHWEYIVTDDGRLALVEAQLRPAGDHIMLLILRSTGSDAYRAFFQSLKQQSNCFLPEFKAQQFAASFFPVPERSVLGSFSVDCEEALVNLKEWSLFISEEVAEATSWDHTINWRSRYVSVVTTGATFESAQQACEQILSHVTIRRSSADRGAESISLKVPL